MPNFEAQNRPLDFNELVAQARAQAEKAKADLAVLQARLNKAPAGAKGAIEGAITALQTKIAHSEAYASQVEKNTAEKLKSAAGSEGPEALRARLAGARERARIVLSPELQKASDQLAFDEAARKIADDYDSLPAAEKHWKGGPIQVPPDQKRAA